jgi:DNA-binding MarR family transcriptional regulator
LADLLELQPMTLARLLDQLVAAELVERRADPADRRAYRVFLRPAAAAQLAAIREVASALQADVMQDLDEQQTAAVFHALNQIRDSLASRRGE